MSVLRQQNSRLCLEKIKRAQTEFEDVRDTDMMVSDVEGVGKFDDFLYQTPRLVEKPVEVKPDILKLFTPLDLKMLEKLNEERDKAIREGNIDKLREIEKNVEELVSKYEMVDSVDVMKPESFIARKLKAHVGIRRDYIPLISKAVMVVKKLPKLFNITLGSVSVCNVVTDDYAFVPSKGQVELGLRIKPVASIVPYRTAIVKIDINNDKAQIIPYLWDTLGRRFDFDTAGLEKFFGVRSFDDLRELERSYLNEEREISRKLRSGEYTPAVYGIGRRPVTPSGSGISVPKTSWS